MGSAKNLKGEKILVRVKSAEYEEDEQGRKVIFNEYSYKIIFYNYRPAPATVEVVERFYGELQNLQSYPSANEMREGFFFYRLEILPRQEEEITYIAETKLVSLSGNVTD